MQKIFYILIMLSLLSCETSSVSSTINSPISGGTETTFLELSVESSASYLHLGYMAIKLVNTSSETATLSDISADAPASLSTKAVLCNSTGSNCLTDYASTCLSSSTLAAMGSCHFWYKAIASDTVLSGAASLADISVKGTLSGGDYHNLTKQFGFYYRNKLYVGGNFINAGGITTNRIASWDGSTWAALEGGADSSGAAVGSLTLHKGDLYLGGYFSSVDGTAANNVARWNGTNFYALGSGVDNFAYGLKSYSGKLYATGTFSNAGGFSASFIASWNGSTWSTLSEGLSSTGMALDVFGGNLVVGGFFENVLDPGPTTTLANGLAMWNSSDWDTSAIELSAGGIPTVNAICNDGTNLYVGGNFSGAGTGPTITTTKIATYNGTTWSALDDSGNEGVNGDVVAIKCDGSKIYVGGDFTTAGAIAASRVAVWNVSGSTWSSLSATFDNIVRALAGSTNNLYAGGLFTGKISYWNGSSWSSVGITPPDGTVMALQIAPSLVLSE